MSRLQVFHPLPGTTVVSNFLVAQGDGDPVIRNLIGIIWDPSGMVVAVGMALKNPPHWIIPFTDFAPGNGYCLEIIDANTRIRLACSGPFDAVQDDTKGPQIWYPAANSTLSKNGSAYGYSPGIHPIEASVASPTGTPKWFDQSQGPPTNPYYLVTFSNLPLDGTNSSTLTAREKANPTSSTDVKNLSIM